MLVWFVMDLMDDVGEVPLFLNRRGVLWDGMRKSNKSANLRYKTPGISTNPRGYNPSLINPSPHYQIIMLRTVYYEFTVILARKKYFVSVDKKNPLKIDPD